MRASNDSTYTTDGKDNVNKMRSPAGDQDVKSTTQMEREDSRDDTDD